jgi:hypothetical protein
VVRGVRRRGRRHNEGRRPCKSQPRRPHRHQARHQPWIVGDSTLFSTEMVIDQEKLLSVEEMKICAAAGCVFILAVQGWLALEECVMCSSSWGIACAWTHCVCVPNQRM